MVRKVLTGLYITIIFTGFGSIYAQNSMNQRPDLAIIEGSVPKDSQNILSWLKNSYLPENLKYIDLQPLNCELSGDKIIGYVHQNDSLSLLVLYNPDIYTQKITFKFSDFFQFSIESDLIINETYPLFTFYPDLQSYNSMTTFVLSGYDLKVLEISNSAVCRYPLIAGPFLIEKARHTHSVIYDLLVDPSLLACADILGEIYLDNLSLNERNLSADEFRRYMCKYNKYETSEYYPDVSVDLYLNDSIDVSILPRDTLDIFEGHIGILLDAYQFPDLTITSVKCSRPTDGIVIRRRNSGDGIWLLIPEDSMRKNELLRVRFPCQSDLKDSPISVWALGAVHLKEVGSLKLYSNSNFPNTDQLQPGKKNTRPIVIPLHSYSPN